MKPPDAPPTSSSAPRPVPDSPPADAWQTYAASHPPSPHRPPSSHPAWPLTVLRSSQLDAARLDDELTSMLRNQLHAIFQYLAPGANLAWEHELNALLHLCVYGLALWTQDSTPGAILTNLKFISTAPSLPTPTPATPNPTPTPTPATPTPTPTVRTRDINTLAGSPLRPAQKALFGLGYVAGPLLHNALLSALSAASPASRASATALTALHLATATFRAASLLNLAAFFAAGRHRSLWERLLGIRLAYTQPTMSRLVSFEYLNRQLVWHEISEFLLYFLPLVDTRKLRAAVLKLLPSLTAHPSAASSAAAALSSAALPPASSRDEGGSSSSTGAQAGGDGAGAAGSTNEPCPICGMEDVLLRYEALPCRHVYCYYCLRAHCDADPQFSCPCDGVRVEAMRVHRPAGRSSGGGS